MSAISWDIASFNPEPNWLATVYSELIRLWNLFSNPIIWRIGLSSGCHSILIEAIRHNLWSNVMVLGPVVQFVQSLTPQMNKYTLACVISIVISLSSYRGVEHINTAHIYMHVTRPNTWKVLEIITERLPNICPSIPASGLKRCSCLLSFFGQVGLFIFGEFYIY